MSTSQTECTLHDSTLNSCEISPVDIHGGLNVRVKPQLGVTEVVL